MQIKSVIKRWLPRQVGTWLTNWRAGRVQRQYAGLTIAQTFDRIYETKTWGARDALTGSSGDGSSGPYVEAYAKMIEATLRGLDLRTVADLGCGDFHVGRVISGMVDEYTGVDIAKSVIDANTRLYSRPGVKFAAADLTRDALPRAQAAILRQVLQHLSNAEIALALDNILRAYPLAIVTEHIFIGPGARPNLDIRHGPGTRVPLKSGVWVDQPPFGLAVSEVGDIPRAPNEVLRTWIVRRPVG